MRDPKRIPRLLSRLARAWRAYPDFRLGQLLTNVFGERLPWHMEDEEFVEAVENYMFGERDE